MLLRSVSTRGEGGVDGSISSDHVIAEKVGAVDCEDELGPAVGAGGLEGNGKGEIPDNPADKVRDDLLIILNPALTFPPCRGSFC